MKRLALVAVVLVAACSTQEKPAADTAAPAMAPAPAMSADSVSHDSTAAAKMDTTKAKIDSTAKKP